MAGKPHDHRDGEHDGHGHADHDHDADSEQAPHAQSGHAGHGHDDPVHHHDGHAEEGDHGHDHGDRGHGGHGHRGHGHGGHGHAHAPADFGKAFAVGITLNLGFVIVEAIYGTLSNSLSLLADAGHNFGDVLGLVLAWGASVLVKKMPTQRRTYGLRRTSILASLVNALILLFATGAIAWEAIGRFAHPEPVASGVVMAVAAVGIAVNGFSAWLFASGSDDVNIRGAFLHLASDAVVALGVVVAAVVMRYTGWQWLDPAVSLAIVVAIAIGTWGLLRESVDLALDAVPRHIDPAKVESWLAALPGVEAVHDLHIWGMSTTEAALTVHLVRPNPDIDDMLLARIHRELRSQFRIDHVTVQFERGRGDFPCEQAPGHVV
ncbi:MAG: cation transporter [Proteobacteria bacterium]|nr:cation transporter [Pseudomonadota bacterium]MBS0598860.1 cation transporter [Pseudomonadota bacterium]